MPFFERESDRARTKEDRQRLESESLKYLKLASQGFAMAGESYQRAARAGETKAGAKSGPVVTFCRRKAAEMAEHTRALSHLIAAKEQAQKAWPPKSGR